MCTPFHLTCNNVLQARLDGQAASAVRQRESLSLILLLCMCSCAFVENIRKHVFVTLAPCLVMIRTASENNIMRLYKSTRVGESYTLYAESGGLLTTIPEEPAVQDWGQAKVEMAARSASPAALPQVSSLLIVCVWHRFPA
jgi:hypothetical protein